MVIDWSEVKPCYGETPVCFADRMGKIYTDMVTTTFIIKIMKYLMLSPTMCSIELIINCTSSTPKSDSEQMKNSFRHKLFSGITSKTIRFRQTNSCNLNDYRSLLFENILIRICNMGITNRDLYTKRNNKPHYFCTTEEHK